MTSTRPRTGRPLVKALVAVAAVTAVAVALLGWRGGDDPDGTGAAASQAPILEIPADQRSAPIEYAGTTVNGEPLSFADLRGQVVVVNVWGSWCAPCRAEAPALARVSADTADQGVQFVGLNVKDNPASARAFEQTFGITIPASMTPTAERCSPSPATSHPRRCLPR